MECAFGLDEDQASFACKLSQLQPLKKSDLASGFIPMALGNLNSAGFSAEELQFEEPSAGASESWSALEDTSPPIYRFFQTYLY